MLSKKIRSSNFELLRIVAMFMIVLSHYCVHGVRTVTNYNIDFTHESFFYLCSSFGEIAVGLFFMLSGYLLYAKTPNFKRIKTLLYQIYFYCIVLLIIGGGYKLLGKNQAVINGEYFVNCLFPLGRSTWWFFSVYLLLYITCDSFRLIFDEMEKNLFIKVILLFWIFFFFVPAFVGEPFRSLQRGVFFFLCGRYCRIYKPMQNVSKRFLFVLMILLLVVCSFASFAGDFVSTHFNIPAGLMKRFITGFRSGFLVPACTICIYQIFDSLDIGTINWINVIASGSFGVYLIHDSPIKILIWKIFRIENAWKSPFFIVFALSSCVFLFSICILIDLLREKVIKAIKK